MKIGLYFGSFNPIHIGHLLIGNVALEGAGLDELWYVVTPQSPFKRSKSLAPEWDRLRMVELAIEDNYRFRASNIEFDLPKPNYTINTLAHLAERHPGKDFRLILGEDNLSSFHRWKNYEKILEYHGLVVYPRPNAKESDLKNHQKVEMIEAPLLDISATLIRKLVKGEKSVKYLIPDTVEAYIRDKKLYND